MKIQPNMFLTADTHFGHHKMVDWGHRTETYNEDIVAAWNSVVHKDDVVLHLGDLTMSKKEETKRWTDQLMGTKFLIRGNHDGESDGWFRDCGFETIPASFRIFKDKYDNHYSVLFTHEPVQDLPDNWFNIHGHLHGNSHRGEKPTDRHFDVGVDAVGFTPVRLSELLSHKIFKVTSEDELNNLKKQI